VLDGSCCDRGYGEINRTVIRCSCGHRVVSREVIQTGLYLSVLGPSFVYVRYRCGRCKRVGEKLVQEDAWDPSVLQTPLPKANESDRQRFEEMGDITPEEVIDFHFALERLTAEVDREAGRH
jgi:DNA-directed RNA polymerase subunit RPC12/RpoP